jgi:microcin C transport system permease protein
MLAYILRRLALIVPTLLGILVINFAIVQVAPGGPVEQLIAQITGTAVEATARVGGTAGGAETSAARAAAAPQAAEAVTSRYRGAQGLDPEFIAELEKQFGFDKPAHERFFLMLWNYARFDFGTSYYRDRRVVDLVIEKLPVSVSLGLWTTLLVYLISIPLGIAKAVRDGSKFDLWSSIAIVIGYAIPSFLFAVLLIVLFAGGSYLSWFPLRGLVSENWSDLAWPERILDYFWHLALPISAMVIGGFAGLTMLTKNSFLEEINKQYVLTARAKGLSERRVLYGHVFRNAMLIVIAGFPGAFIGILFTSALLIEVIFSLDGLGLLGFEAAIKRDYPIMFGSLYVFTLLGLVVNLISDLTYTLIDPRIDFESREVAAEALADGADDRGPSGVEAEGRG